MNTRWVAMVLGGLFGAVIIAGLVLPDIEAAREANRQNSAAIRGTGTQGTDAITDRQSDGSASKGKTFLGLKRT